MAFALGLPKVAEPDMATGQDKAGRQRAAQRSVRLDVDRLARVERLVMYEIGNTLLLNQLELQREFGLRAEALQVFLMIVLATTQRYVRGASPDDPAAGSDPLAPADSGAVSRRRIAEALGIPLETVRRHVAALAASGLVAERGRGRIATTGGTLARLRAAGVSEGVARRQHALTGVMMRLAVLVPDGGGGQPLRDPAPDAADQSGSDQISRLSSPSSAI
jgi:DNA-binding transcriptional ArsR family regulator